MFEDPVSKQAKIKLAMNVVNQETGEDLDPEHVQSGGRGGGGGGGGGGNSRDGKPLSSDPPDMYSLHQGAVQGIQTFGAFVTLPGFRSNGLIHITQIRNDKRVELVTDELNVGMAVWVKVIGCEPNMNGKGGWKLSLSMKYVNQSTGEDLDPSHDKLLEEKERRNNSSDQNKSDQMRNAVHGDAVKASGSSHPDRVTGAQYGMVHAAADPNR